MTPIQQLYLGVGAKKKTYLDEVFSTQVYRGTGSNRSFVNGLDLSSEGGLVWTKCRSGSSSMHHMLFDTERGVTKDLIPSTAGAEGTSTTMVTAFNTDGYSLGSSGYVNENNSTFASWSFRKAEGFCDVVTYTGNGTNGRTISHSLGSVPGMIMVKRLSGSSNWAVYHRGTDQTAPEDYWITLNENYTRQNQPHWNDTKPTSTHFTVGTDYEVNANTQTYIAYVFAGGESSAATARSLDFAGTNGANYLKVGSSSDFTMGTGDFTVECWAKFDDNTENKGIFQISDNSAGLKATVGSGIAFAHSGSNWRIYANGGQHNVSAERNKDQWYHIAVVRNSGVTKSYVDGVQVHSLNDTQNYDGTYIGIGGYYAADNYIINGKISNFRVVKGTAVYTSAFRPPTEPLTNITNTKLLCCNDSSTTGSTVTPGTITSTGNSAITALTDSPFDDPAGFKFGDSKEGIIKCGSYVGNGSDTGPEIHLGWEPQWVMLRRTDDTDNWAMYDVMRGITTDGTDNQLRADTNAAEHTTGTTIDVTSTGFKITTLGSEVNANNGEYIYIAIRRPDGYVGKPVETATSVFAMDTGSGSSTIPTYDSGFPVDYAFTRQYASSGEWYTSARLVHGQVNYISTSNEHGSGNFIFDSSTGWAVNHTSAFQSWMWKRHAGLDVVTYDGTGNAGNQISHSMNKIPEMMWIFRRDAVADIPVYHHGLNGGTNPWEYWTQLNDTNAQGDTTALWNDTAPTTTHFTLGTNNWVNNNNGTYMALLFASVSGISKVGSYTGTGSSGNAQNIGFQPRFLTVKRVDTTGAWYTFDSDRSGSNPFRYQLELNTLNTQDFVNKVTVSSTGWSFVDLNINENGAKYLYYAHA